MTTNEKRVLTQILYNGPLTKKEICKYCSFSWATAVKIVSQLERRKIITFKGTPRRKNVSGKDSAVYDISSEALLVLGMDVEYHRTHLALTNLKDEIITEFTLDTPVFTSVEHLELFIYQTLERFLSMHPNMELTGIGIVIPSFIIQTEQNIFQLLKENLSRKLPVPVQIDNIVRSYTLYKAHSMLAHENFLVVTIRSGIGVGIFVNDRIFRGDDMLSGELSHVTIDRQGEFCRCGKRGCLETKINQHILYQKYEEAYQTASSLEAGLHDLFSKAASGESAALGIIEEAADYLARGLSLLLLILNINRIYLSGHFGAHGDVIIKHIQRQLEKYLYARISYEIIYEPLQEHYFTSGARLLIYTDYLDYR